ncbi:hypothetical protein SRHO_G00124960 [Serrasalmus rhombeus]
MAQIWILILCLYITGSAQTVDLSEASFVPAKPGEPVTLHCEFVEKFPHNNWVWYKQRSGQEPQEVAVKLPTKEPTLSSDSKIRFKIHKNFSLTIQQTTKDDEGMYFCGTGDERTITFSHGTFLAVAAEPQLNVSVVQTPAWRSVSPGESVTQQCMVHSKTGAAELRNNFSHSDAGTYYCAVAACGKIIVSNQASVQLKGPVDPVIIFLGAALGVCVVVISAETIIIFKRRNSDHGSGKNLQGSSAENTTNQTAESLNYAPIHFKENKPKPGRVKREQPEDIVYSQVRSSNAKAHRSHR